YTQSFFSADPPTTDIHTLSLHDALPISVPRILNVKETFEDLSTSLYSQHFYGFASYLFLVSDRIKLKPAVLFRAVSGSPLSTDIDRKSTRLNSSHVKISYAVFCLKKKQI